jgi:hypothetical protein
MSYTPPELDSERLILIAGGHTAFQLLWAGVELGLYDKLSAKPGQTLGELAQSMGLAHQPARILLIGLTALGVLKLENERYHNAEVTEERMVSGKPGYVAPILGWQAHIVYPGMMDFLTSLKENRNAGLARFPGTEPTLYERLTHDNGWKIFQDSMSNLSNRPTSCPRPWTSAVSSMWSMQAAAVAPMHGHCAGLPERENLGFRLGLGVRSCPPEHRSGRYVRPGRNLGWQLL